ncbi:hypothetical protein NKH18_42300 [Streptomyces sp. M10(2022)]
MYATATAAAMLPALGMRNALVVCAENPRPILNFDYRYSALFGAGPPRRSGPRTPRSAACSTWRCTRTARTSTPSTSTRTTRC